MTNAMPSRSERDRLVRLIRAYARTHFGVDEDALRRWLRARTGKGHVRHLAIEGLRIVADDLRILSGGKATWDSGAAGPGAPPAVVSLGFGGVPRAARRRGQQLTEADRAALASEPGCGADVSKALPGEPAAYARGAAHARAGGLSSANPYSITEQTPLFAAWTNGFASARRAQREKREAARIRAWERSGLLLRGEAEHMAALHIRRVSR